MKVLLDTHIWLWMLSQPDRLGRQTRAIIEDPSTSLLLSAATSWEIAVKNSIGRLPLPEPVSSYVPSRMRQTGVESLAISHSHALQVAALPHHHRDPFDRLLIAQAQLENLPLMTIDGVLRNYDIEVIWGVD